MNRSITYFFRHPAGGFSIAKVSRIFVDHFAQVRKVRQLTLPFHNTGISAVFKNLVYTYRHRDRQGINHLTGDSHYIILALLGCRSVLTVHDMSMLDNQTSSLKYLFFKYAYFVLPLRFASRVVCISEATRRSVLRFTSRTDIEVIPDAVDTSIFHPSPKTFDTDCPRILMIGTGWNKNVEREIRALQGISCCLLIVGQLTPDINRALEETQARYEHFQNLSDEEIFGLYCQSDLVLFCSFYEGFGMPVIEANMTGRPVITSYIHPLIDVASDAACFVKHPDNVQEIRQAVLKVLGDSSYRDRLVENGRRNVERFLPSIVTDAYARVYDSL